VITYLPESFLNFLLSLPCSPVHFQGFSWQAQNLCLSLEIDNDPSNRATMSDRQYLALVRDVWIWRLIRQKIFLAIALREDPTCILIPSRKSPNLLYHCLPAYDFLFPSSPQTGLDVECGVLCRLTFLGSTLAVGSLPKYHRLQIQIQLRRI
jgi:hypothetical protein